MLIEIENPIKTTYIDLVLTQDQEELRVWVF